jgi:hypothetical protein
MKYKEDCAHLKIFEEKGEFMARAVQVSDDSAAGTGSPGRRVLTTSRLPPVVV